MERSRTPGGLLTTAMGTQATVMPGYCTMITGAGHEFPSTGERALKSRRDKTQAGEV